MFGSFLMAAYNTQTRSFESVCKLGTGFTHARLKEISLEPLSDKPEKAESIAKNIYKVSPFLKPDVWFAPQEVWEVQADCFTQSTSHMAGRDFIRHKTGKNSGLSLRFPRYVRPRDDKQPKIGGMRITLEDYVEGNESFESGPTTVQDILHMHFGPFENDDEH